MKSLRGTYFDIFAYGSDRRMERKLLSDYEADLETIEALLSAERIEAAAALASVPMLIRGYGHVKEANAHKASAERARLTERLKQGDGVMLEAAQ